MIIGLAGHKESGKDETAKVLAKFGIERLAFADPLRAEVEHWARLMQWPREMPDDLYMETLGIEPAEIYAKPTSPRARRLLQWWGGDFRRGQDEDYWIHIAESRIRAGRNYAITDTRYENEARWVWARGGQIWVIDRPGYDGDDHASEQLPKILKRMIRRSECPGPARIIRNDGDLAHLDRIVTQALGESRGY